MPRLRDRATPRLVAVHEVAVAFDGLCFGRFLIFLFPRESVIADIRPTFGQLMFTLIDY